MSSPQPPQPPPGNGAPSGKGESSASASQQQANQQILDIFGTDHGTAIMTLVLLLLGLVKAAMTRCVC
jgi:hypothetical protein